MANVKVARPELIRLNRIRPLLDNDDELEKLYKWVDQIPLSRPKKNMTRDFSDGGKHLVSYRYYNIG